MNKHAAILQQYQVLPQGMIQITDRLTQVKANGKKYALKRSRLTTKNVDDWLNVYYQAHERNLSGVLPLYMTTTKELYVEAEGEIYYLMPWLETTARDPSKEVYGELLRSIGNVHLETKQVSSLKDHHLEEEFLAYQHHCLKSEEKLLHYIKEFEKKYYPSPLELQVLTHYRDLSFALKESKQLVTTITRELEEEVYWGRSLKHGKLDQNHFLQPYLINWEEASMDHAMYDLLDLFSSEIANNYRSVDFLLEAFPSYLDENPLQTIELAMISLHLLNLDDYLVDLNHFHSIKQRRESMISQTMQMDKRYRKIVFGLRFKERMNEYRISKETEDGT